MSFPTQQPPATPPPVPAQPDGPAHAAPKPRRGLLIAVIAAAVVLLMAGTGVSVWWLTRPAGSTNPFAGDMLVAGGMHLGKGDYVGSDTNCYGEGGYGDIRAGADVTVTAATGRVLAVGHLDRGQVQPSGDCVLNFKVSVPRGQGPYGLEISHRGVTHYNEGETGAISLGF